MQTSYSSGSEGDTSISEDKSPPAEPIPEANVVDAQLLSPSEDFRTYAHLITRLAKALGLSVEQPPPTDSDVIYDDITLEQVQPVSLIFIKSLLKLIKESWAKPSSVPQVSRRVESLYKTQGNEADFLYKHLLPNSLTVKAAQAKSHSRSEIAPTNKEGRKLDGVGKRQYSLVTFVLHAANYLAAMGAYHRHLWNQALHLFNSLPDEALAKGSSL